MIEAALGAAAGAIVAGFLTYLGWWHLRRRIESFEDQQMWGLDDIGAEFKHHEARWDDLNVRLMKLEKERAA